MCFPKEREAIIRRRGPSGRFGSATNQNLELTA